MLTGRPDDVLTGRPDDVLTGRPGDVFTGRPGDVFTGRPVTFHLDLRQTRWGRPILTSSGRPQDVIGAADAHWEESPFAGQSDKRGQQ